MLPTLFSGRMSRRNFLWGQCIILIITLIAIITVLQGNISLQGLLDHTEQLQQTLLILAPVGFLFQFVCSWRRLHDINQSGLWALLLLASLVFIPFVDAILLIYLSYKKGDKQSNQFGHPDTRPIIGSLLNR